MASTTATESIMPTGAAQPAWGQRDSRPFEADSGRFQLAQSAPGQSSSQLVQPGAGLCEDIFALRHALLVCNSYKEDAKRKTLTETVPTGRKLQDALVRCGFKVRLCEGADGKSFQEALSALVCELRSRPRDEHLVLFYFAGHGAEQCAGEGTWTDLMMQMQGDDTNGASLRAVLEGLLQAAPKVGVVALPDCCRESKDGTFRASAPGTPGTDLELTGNFLVVWAGDRGTCIEDNPEDNLGFQLAAILKESRGGKLDEVLKLLS